MKRVVVVALLAACTSRQAQTTAHVEIIVAPPTDAPVASYIAGEVARGQREHVPVLVYVGATWCEPCRDFHAAATAGSLDSSLAPLRFIEFDLDRDGERLAAAGYRSELVPLFAKPAPDGRASGAQTEGVIKGGGYVEQLTPKIQALVH